MAKLRKTELPPSWERRGQGWVLPPALGGVQTKFFVSVGKAKQTKTVKRGKKLIRIDPLTTQHKRIWAFGCEEVGPDGKPVVYSLTSRNPANPFLKLKGEGDFLYIPEGEEGIKIKSAAEKRELVEKIKAALAGHEREEKILRVLKRAAGPHYG